MKKTSNMLWAVLWISFMGASSLWAQTNTLTADGEVGLDFPAAPSDVTVVSGVPNTYTEHTYDLGGNTLDMSEYSITSGTNQSMILIADAVTYDTGSATGGTLDFSGDASGFRGRVTITATDTVNLRELDTSADGSGSRAGNVTISATNGITIADGIKANHSGNSYSGEIKLDAVNGAVNVGGLIDSGGARRPYPITINALSISVKDLWAGSTAFNFTCPGKLVTLNATAGDVTVDGSINTWSGQDTAGAGDVLLSASGDVLVTGGITNRSYRSGSGAAKAGNVTITAGGTIDIQAMVNSDVSHVDARRGDLSLTAGGAITLAGLDVNVHSNITLTASLASGTTIVGELLGLDDDIVDSVIDRFTAATGNVYYDPGLAGNGYLGGGTYEIANSVGGTFEVKPAPPVLPTVSTPTHTDILYATARLGGTVDSAGFAPIDERGVYWSTTDGFTPPGQGTKASQTGTYFEGTFDLSVSGLPSNTNIFYRAFAINSVGTGFSDQSSFATLVAPTDYVLAEDGTIGLDLVATPSDVVVSGDATNVIYDLLYHSLDMDAYRVTNEVEEVDVLFQLGALTYDSNSAEGGVLDLSGILARGSLTIEAMNSIELRSVKTLTTQATGSSLAGAGHVTLTASDGLLVADAIDASAVGNARGGDISLSVTDGAITVGGEIKTGDSRYPGSVQMTAREISLSDVLTTTVSNSGDAGPVGVTSTVGRIDIGMLDLSAVYNGGDLTLTATGGGIATGPIDTSAFHVNGRTGGKVTILSDAEVSVASIDASVARISTNLNTDAGGPIEIMAGNDVTVAGAIKTYVSNANTNSAGTLRSRSGDITITSANGNIGIGGAIDASHPDPMWDGTNYMGNLTLSAVNGSNTLASLNVDHVNEITLIAASGKGTLIIGPLEGLGSDIGDSDIDRFTSVVGDVYYDDEVPENAYLNSQTYPIVNSVGGPFNLMPLAGGPPPLPTPPEIASFGSLPGGAFGAVVLTEMGVDYTLWYTTNLVANPVAWFLADTQTGDGANKTLQDATPIDSLRIYRIIAE